MEISLYYQMVDYGLVPDNFTYPFVLKACSALSAIDAGRDIHENVIRTGWEMDFFFMGAALIDMYAKCGCVDNSRQVVDKIIVRDVVLWNSMLAAYSQNGHPEECLALCGEMASKGLRPSDATLVTAISASADTAALPKGRALNLFQEMTREASPDHITFVLVLSACKHGGLLDERRKYFESMKKDYHIEPTIQHYTCMIDLLGHCSRLNEAYDLIMQMKMLPDSGVWGALLNSCKDVMCSCGDYW